MINNLLWLIVLVEALTKTERKQSRAAQNKHFVAKFLENQSENFIVISAEYKYILKQNRSPPGSKCNTKHKSTINTANRAVTPHYNKQDKVYNKY